ncbi:MAG: hypothetical protein WAL83_05160 [Arenicellales bacterium]|jgi:hypothetical protein
MTLQNLLVALLVISAWAPASQGAEGIRIELNKLEPMESACRAYLLFQNNTSAEFQSLKLDLVMFNPDGIINKRLAVEGGPLPAGKTSVKLFDIDGVTCDSVGRVLLNGVLACTDSAGERTDCLQMIETASRSKADFFK